MDKEAAIKRITELTYLIEGAPLHVTGNNCFWMNKLLEERRQLMEQVQNETTENDMRSREEMVDRLVKLNNVIDIWENEPGSIHHEVLNHCKERDKLLEDLKRDDKEAEEEKYDEIKNVFTPGVDAIECILNARNLQFNKMKRLHGILEAWKQDKSSELTLKMHDYEKGCIIFADVELTSPTGKKLYESMKEERLSLYKKLLKGLNMEVDTL